MKNRFLLAVPVLALNFSSAVAFVAADDSSSWRDTVQKIDAVFERVWQEEGIVPAPDVADSEFVRRVYLDVIGRIPAVSEVREFQASELPSQQKREQLVDRLLQSPAYIRHLTISLRNSLIPEAGEQANLRFLVPGFDAWLWQKLADRTPYNELAHQIITTDFGDEGNAATNASRPDAFFVVREFKPENLATATSRAFLGVRLDCAQCHDHPFDRWTQDQFWSMAAFYSGFQQQENRPLVPGMMAPSESDNWKIQVPGTDRTVTAGFLTGSDWDPSTAEQSARQILADWVVSEQNPWFAKMAVNRQWNQYFGRGLVDPIDDFSENNPSALPEVLEILADDFKSSGYRFERTIRILTSTKAYQRSSRQTDDSQADPEVFARSALRGLTPEQFFDSLAEATGFYQPYRSDNPFVIQQNTPRAQFLNLFRSSDRSALERQTTVLQALAMMNGDFVGNATSIEDSMTMKAVSLFPGMSTEKKIETLYLATLSRQPNESELQRTKQHVATANSIEEGLADVFWVLLNSSEFLLNH